MKQEKSLLEQWQEQARLAPVVFKTHHTCFFCDAQGAELPGNTVDSLWVCEPCGGLPQR